MKQSKKWMLVALALLAMVALPLVGCKNDSVSEPVRYTVTFNTDGGSTVQSQTVESGKTATEPADPTKAGYVFVGWYSDEAFTNKYDFTTPVTSSFTLYAKWGIGITSDTVSDVIAGLSEGGPHTLVATGEWSAGDLLAIRTALKKKPTAKVHLDLSKVSDLTTIGEGAFVECSSLTSITIPASVETIERHAFDGCSSLTSITIPASVKTIERHAFERCSSLARVTMEAKEPPTLEIRAFDITADTLQILVPSGSVDDYKRADGWKDLTIEAK